MCINMIFKALRDTDTVYEINVFCFLYTVHEAYLISCAVAKLWAQQLPLSGEVQIKLRHGIYLRRLTAQSRARQERRGFSTGRVLRVRNPRKTQA